MSLIDRLLGRQTEGVDFKRAIALGTKALSALNFQFDKFEDSGMFKYAVLSGDKFNLTFYYNKGFIDCYVEYKNKFKFDMVQLVNFIDGQEKSYDLPDYKWDMLKVIKEYSFICEHTFQNIDNYLSNSSDNELKASEQFCTTEAQKVWSTKLTGD